jgi:hypothetical protein
VGAHVGTIHIDIGFGSLVFGLASQIVFLAIVYNH